MGKANTTLMLTMFLVLLLFSLPRKINAQIITFGSQKFELCRSRNLQNISWSASFQQEEDGIRFEKNKSEYHSTDYWLQSEPFSVGEAWRPPTSASMFVGFDGEISKEFWENTNVYIRYSADKVHWSSWSSRNRIDAGSKDHDSLQRLYTNDSKNVSSLYNVSVSIPAVARTEYQKLFRVWMKSKEYVNIEHFFFIWLAKNYPSYFEREIPLIGYVQFRVKGNSYGLASLAKINSIYFNYHYSISGLGYFDVRDEDDLNVNKKVEIKPKINDSESTWHFDLSKYKVNPKNQL